MSYPTTLQNICLVFMPINRPPTLKEFSEYFIGMISSPSYANWSMYAKVPITIGSS
jgi:hypothetical protein